MQLIRNESDGRSKMYAKSLGSLGKRLLSSIIVSAIIIVLLVILCVVGVHLAFNANIKDQRALDSIEESFNYLVKSLIDQETGQRGYYLTKEESFLVPYYDGEKQFSLEAEDLLKSTKKFPDLNTEINELIRQGQYWQENFGENNIDEMTRNGVQPSIETLYKGKEALDTFRLTADNFIESVEKHRTIVRELSKKRIKMTLTTLMFALIGIMFINLWINFRIIKPVIKTIIELNRCVKSYAKLDFSKGIPTYRKNDELFELIENVDVMRTKLANSISSLESMANHDELTGLYNRRYFNEFLLKEWEKAKENEKSFSLIFFDIDHFKRFNDTYGHLAGDECLKSISQNLQKYNEDSSSFAARYGGEEFGVILLNQSEQEAVFIAEEIRKSILDLKIPHKSSATSEFVTASMGVATIVPDANLDPYDIISFADDALYESKQNGRNQVTVYNGVGDDTHKIFLRK